MSGPACLRSGPVQIAYGVDDLDVAVEAWQATGAGPFVVRRNIEVATSSVVGEGDEFDHSSAYGWWGDVMVELVQVHAPAELARPGLHHLAFFVDSFAEATRELDGLGWPAVLTARAGKTDFAFHDATESLGHLIEIYEASDALLAFYRHIRSLHS